MTAKESTPEDRENVTVAQLPRKDDVFESMSSLNIELVADDLRDTARHSEGPAETATRLREIEQQVGMLADMAEGIAGDEQ